MPRSDCGHQKVAEVSLDMRRSRRSHLGGTRDLCSKNTNPIYEGFFLMT